MNATNYGQAPAKKEQTLLTYGGQEVAYKEINGHLMVNITQMARPFDKMPKDWLKTQQYKDLRKALSDRIKIPSTDLQQVTRGGKNQGTWVHDELGLIFAQWLSPEFYLECNMALKKAVQGQVVPFPAFNGVHPLMDGVTPYFNYLEALKSLGASTQSGSVAARKKRFSPHFKKFFGRNFITLPFFKYLVAERRVQEARTKLQGNQTQLGI